MSVEEKKTEKGKHVLQLVEECVPYIGCLLVIGASKWYQKEYKGEEKLNPRPEAFSEVPQSFELFRRLSVARKYNELCYSRCLQSLDSLLYLKRILKKFKLKKGDFERAETYACMTLKHAKSLKTSISDTVVMVELKPQFKLLGRIVAEVLRDIQREYKQTRKKRALAKS